MKIYTKSGDRGKSQIMGRSNLNKSNTVFSVLGTLDELNSIIGICCLYVKSKNLKTIQDSIFLVGTYFSLYNKKLFLPKDIKKIKLTTNLIEKEIDVIEKKLLPLKNFILPGGGRSSAYLHLARSVTRRCERHIVKLNARQKIDAQILIFVNRLSDYFFVLARYQNKKANISDKLWKN